MLISKLQYENREREENKGRGQGLKVHDNFRWISFLWYWLYGFRFMENKNPF